MARQKVTHTSAFKLWIVILDERIVGTARESYYQYVPRLFNSKKDAAAFARSQSCQRALAKYRTAFNCPNAKPIAVPANITISFDA